MATVNFMLTSPVVTNTDMEEAEDRMVTRVKELFKQLQQLPGVSVAMSDIGYTDGKEYSAVVSLKNQWSDSGAQLKRVAKQFDPQYMVRLYGNVGRMRYYTDLSRLEQVEIADFRQYCNEVSLQTTEGQTRIFNALGVELLLLPARMDVDYYNHHHSLFRVQYEQFDGERKTGYIDKYGFPVMDTVYDEISAPDKEGLCYASFRGRKGIVKPGDKQLIPCVYNELKGENLNLLKDPHKLDEVAENWISIFSENEYLLANKTTDAGQCWGVIDRGNKVVISFQFETLNEVYADDARYAKFGFLIGKKDGKVGMIDKDGSVAIPFEYDYLGLHDRDNSQLGRVDDGYLIAYKDNKVGIVDINNKIAMPFRYSPKEILQIEYPLIYFSIRPKHTTQNECRAELSRLEELCKKQDWTYEWSSDGQVYMSGQESMNELCQHFREISESVERQAIEILKKYAPDDFNLPSIELTPRERSANAKIYQLSLPRNGYGYSPEEKVGVYITPQERVNALVKKIREAEAVRSSIESYSYNDFRNAALEDGIFPPSSYEFNMDQEQRLSEIESEIDVLYGQLEVAEANVQKFAVPLERRKDGLSPSNTLHNIEQGIKEKMSKAALSHNYEQKM